MPARVVSPAVVPVRARDRPGGNFVGIGRTLRRGLDLRIQLPAWLLALTLVLISMTLLLAGAAIQPYLYAETEDVLVQGGPVGQPSITTITVTATGTANGGRCTPVEDETTQKKRRAEQANTNAAVKEGCLLEARAAEVWDMPWGSVGLEEFLRAQGDHSRQQPPSPPPPPPSSHNHNRRHHHHHGRSHGAGSGAARKKTSETPTRDKVLCAACLHEEGRTTQGQLRFQPLLERIISYLDDPHAFAVYKRVFPREGTAEEAVWRQERRRHVEGTCQHVWVGKKGQS